MCRSIIRCATVSRAAQPAAPSVGYPQFPSTSAFYPSLAGAMPLGRIANDCVWRDRIKKEQARLDGTGSFKAYVRSNLLSDGPEWEPKPRPTTPSSSSSIKSSGASSVKPTTSVLSSKGARSQLSVARTSSSTGLPSNIRSSEPSAIVRTKLAELQLKLELERVLRLERENELEQQRQLNMKLKSSIGSPAEA